MTTSSRPALSDARPLPRRPSFIVRVAPLIGIVALTASVLRQVLRPVSDPDVWWHLRLGEDILNGRSLTDPGAFGTFADASWVPTQWLPEIVAAMAQRQFGMSAIVWLFALALYLLLGGLYLLARRTSEPLSAVMVVGIALIAMSGSISPRPHMVTYLFVGITLMAWLRSAEDLRPRWWLIPMGWVWACSHGMWFLGPILGACVLVGLILDGRPTRDTRIRLAAVPLLSVIAAAVTPVGPSLLLAPFAVGDVSQLITEWAPPNFREPGPATAALLVAVVVVAWSRTGHTAWVSLSVLSLAVGLILLSARTVTVGSILLVPLAAPVIQSWLHRPPNSLAKQEKLTLAATGIGAMLVVTLSAPNISRGAGTVPTQLSPELAALPAQSVVINDYSLGGWLSWQHPDLSRTVDGLTEAYSPSYLTEFGRLMAVMPGWQGQVEQLDATYALVEADSSLGAALQDQLDWVVIGTDAGYVLLERPSGVPPA